MKPLVGELPALELSDETLAELGHVDHLVHCAAIYDITAGRPSSGPPTWTAPAP